MSKSHFDVGIIGGGPMGCALALMLARLTPAPERVALWQSDAESRYGLTSAQDTRVIAINEGSRILLHDLGAWPDDASPILTIHVSQKGRLGRTLITNEEFGVPALGYVVHYASLQTGLLQAVQEAGVSLCYDKIDEIAEIPDGCRLQTNQGNSTVRLAVRADGMNHEREPERHNQVAILGQARVSRPKSGWAFERFTRYGPFAVLPHPAGDGSQSIVWCSSPQRATELMKLDTKQLGLAMTEAFGDRLGLFEVVSAFQAYPLFQSLNPAPVQGRLVSIGNAAQTLHPVAGQGMNLGLRDVATLAHCLRDWMAYPSRDPNRPLDIYRRLRSADRQGTVKLTDLMSRVFTTGWPVIEHAAGLALLALDTIEPLRAPLARHLMQGLRQ